MDMHNLNSSYGQTNIALETGPFLTHDLLDWCPSHKSGVSAALLLVTFVPPLADPHGDDGSVSPQSVCSHDPLPGHTRALLPYYPLMVISKRYSLFALLERTLLRLLSRRLAIAVSCDYHSHQEKGWSQLEPFPVGAAQR